MSSQPKKTPSELTASEAIREIRSGGLKAADLVAACLERIRATEDRVRAWVHLEPEKAIEHARSIDYRIAGGLDPGALCGAPVGVKDIFNTADMPTRMGSPLFENYTPGNDARVVYELRQARATIPGKTVTAEFAVHTLDKTCNPHDLKYSPGTSSSGSAAAVAAGMVPLALGTQTAGSIIRPASYCGVYGFKPSFGLIPRTGSLKTTDSLDQIGFFARSVEDLELLFDILRVRGLDYPLSHAALTEQGRQQVTGRPWRVGVVSSSLWVWGEAYEYAKSSLQEFASALGKTGAAVEEARLPAEFNQAHGIHETIYDKTLAYYFKEEYEQHQLISDALNGMIRHGQTVSLEQYKQAMANQAQLSAQLHRLFDQFDVLISLSTAGTAPKWGAPDIPDASLVWTLCGVPVVNVPLFNSPNGLPYGVQVLARRYNDILLLDFLKGLKRRNLIDDATIAELREPPARKLAS
jgi:Asp-tRNA(Asn)/Glu-tRNA(Gln) amidotransferase A subunit family amidase